MVRGGSSAGARVRPLCARCADVEARARRQDRASDDDGDDDDFGDFEAADAAAAAAAAAGTASDADAGSSATGVEQAPAASGGQREGDAGPEVEIASEPSLADTVGAQLAAASAARGEELAADAPSNASVVGSASVDGRRPDPALAEQRTVVWVEVEAAATALYDGAGVAGTHPDDAWSTMTVADGEFVGGDGGDAAPSQAPSAASVDEKQGLERTASWVKEELGREWANGALENGAQEEATPAPDAASLDCDDGDGGHEEYGAVEAEVDAAADDGWSAARENPAIVGASAADGCDGEAPDATGSRPGPDPACFADEQDGQPALGAGPEGAWGAEASERKEVEEPEAEEWAAFEEGGWSAPATASTTADDEWGAFGEAEPGDAARAGEQSDDWATGASARDALSTTAQSQGAPEQPVAAAAASSELADFVLAVWTAAQAGGAHILAHEAFAAALSRSAEADESHVAASRETVKDLVASREYRLWRQLEAARTSVVLRSWPGSHAEAKLLAAIGLVVSMDAGSPTRPAAQGAAAVVQPSRGSQWAGAEAVDSAVEVGPALYGQQAPGSGEATRDPSHASLESSSAETLRPAPASGVPRGACELPPRLRVTSQPVRTQEAIRTAAQAPARWPMTDSAWSLPSSSSVASPLHSRRSSRSSLFGESAREDSSSPVAVPYDTKGDDILLPTAIAPWPADEPRELVSPTSQAAALAGDAVGADAVVEEFAWAAAPSAEAAGPREWPSGDRARPGAAAVASFAEVEEFLAPLPTSPPPKPAAIAAIPLAAAAVVLSPAQEEQTAHRSAGAEAFVARVPCLDFMLSRTLVFPPQPEVDDGGGL